MAPGCNFAKNVFSPVILSVETVPVATFFVMGLDVVILGAAAAAGEGG